MALDFEASFSDQLDEITREDLIAHPGAPLSAVLEAGPDFTPFCFAFPEPDLSQGSPAALLRDAVFDPASRARARGILIDYADAAATREQMLVDSTDQEQAAMGRILAVLVCAEESAVNIFQHESRRVSAEQIAANQQALAEIESEERVHAWLIQSARSYLPPPDDVDAIRRRTRRLFMRVASRDLPTHFARITGLDSGVCISLTALLGSARVRQLNGFARLLKHIRRDEATHVKKSRDHAMDLGFPASGFREGYALTRTGMVGMLTPIADSFETLGVDPDRLFARLLRFQGESGAGDLDD